MNFVTKCMIGFILSIIMTSTMSIEAHAMTADERLDELAKAKVSTIIEQIITPDMTDTDKAIAVHDWICTNSQYDTDKITDYTAYGPLFNGHGCCAGYADTFHLFMDTLGIKDRRVKGFGKDDYHRWNEVLIDGKYLAIDCTWDDDEDEISREYCLITPEQMAETHTFIKYYDKQELSDDEIREIAKQIVTPDMNDTDKVIAAHNWICENFYYVEDTDCSTDYCEVFTTFMRIYNIPAKRVCGYANNTAWRWNEVRIGDKWLTVDCAQDDLVDTIGDIGGVRSNDYCLVSADKINKNHIFNKYLDRWI